MVFEPIHCPSCDTNANVVTPRKSVAAQPYALTRSTIAPEQLTDISFKENKIIIQGTSSKPLQAGRIFLFTNSPKAVNQPISNTLTRMRQLVAKPLRSQGFTVLEVPSQLSLPEAITWINRRAARGDLALAIQTDAFFNPATRGASAFYVANNTQLRQNAELLLDQLRQTLPALAIRGAKPDTETALGSLTFTRKMAVPAIVLNIGFETNPVDRSLLLKESQDIAQGIANGVADWIRSTLIQRSLNSASPFINIQLNGQAYQQQGILLNRSAYIPANVLNQLKLDPLKTKAIPRIKNGNRAYVRALDLKKAGVFVGWNSAQRTVVLRSVQAVEPKQMGEIIAKGRLSQDTVESFLRSRNPQILEQFPEIVRLYLEEAEIEGVSSDIAIAQALLETNFFRFGNEILPSQNNFGGLGTVGVAGKAATFRSARIGVRAQVQQLKAYASREPLVRDIVSPRFHFVTRGIAPRVEQLSGRYSVDPLYGEKILAILGRLYRFAGLKE